MSENKILTGLPIVITETSSIKEVLETAGNSLVVIGKVEELKNQLQLKVDKYKDFKVTKENFKESKEVRAEIREIRYALQNVSKHNVGVFKVAQNKYKEDINGLIDVVSPTEDRFDKAIKDIENVKKMEKAKKEKEEAERVAKVNREIADARVELEKIVSFGRTDDDMKKFCSLVDNLADRNSKEEFQEFGFEIDNLLEEYNNRLPELTSRIQQIKDDAKKEEENRLQKIHLERRNNFQKLGLVETDGDYSYKGKVLHTSNIVLYTEKEFNEGLGFIKNEIAKIDKIEADAKAKEKAIQKAKDDAEAKKKADEDAKFKAEREQFAKEKAEFDAKKKLETFNFRKKVLLDLGFEYIPPAGDNYNFILKDIWSMFHEQVENPTDEEFDETLKQIKDAIEINEIKISEEKKAKEEAEKQDKIKKEREFNETVEKARKLGVSFEGLDTNGEKQIVIDTLKERITSAEHLLTVEKKKALKEAGAVHIEAISSSHKLIFDYFGMCKIEPEHENAIVTFEDELRASFKKLKNTIS